MKKIGVLTYDRPHRKTQDLLYRLALAGFGDVTVLQLPFVERPVWRPLIPYRNPAPNSNTGMGRICKIFGFKTMGMAEVSNMISHPEPVIPFDCILIGGAPILPKAFVDRHVVINAHPGYLPYARGLDCLKWTIYHDWPIGVATHIVDENVDCGVLIERRIIDLHPMDTFHSIDTKTYDLELAMLVDAVHSYREAIEVNQRLDFPKSSFEGAPPKRRMPHDKEITVYERLKDRLLYV